MVRVRILGNEYDFAGRRDALCHMQAATSETRISMNLDEGKSSAAPSMTKHGDALEGRSKQRSVNEWSQPPSTLAYPTGRVDVWRVRLDELPRAGSRTDSLSADEIARSSRFHFDKDRVHFTRCRAALRSLLGDYLAIPAPEVRFEYHASGKPQLAADQNPRALQFNVSHSANMALIAVGSDHRLGVDLERIRGDVDTSSLAERFFSLRERAELHALSEQLRVAGFFACWTRKEAFLKATGHGLSFPLTDFSVTTHPNQDPELREIKGNAEAAKQWSLRDLIVEGFRATLALDRVQFRMDTYSWN